MGAVRGASRAPLALLLLAPGAGALPQEPRWPLANGSHDVLHGYQNPLLTYFHEGVDLRGNLDDVVAMRGGVVRFHDPATQGGTMVVEVQTPGGTEADAYLHVLLGPWLVGERIEAGDVVGQVSDAYFAQPLQFHLHLNRFDGYVGGTGYVPGRTNMLHPLALFRAPEDRDPQRLPAGPEDADEDGALFWAAPDGDPTTRLPFAFGPVDLVLEATDRMSSSLYWNQGVTSLGYWIESLAGGAGVRDAAQPYRLATFDDAWRASHPDCDLLLGDVVLTSFPWAVAFGTTNTGWLTLANYVLTNTRGVSGSGAEVDAAQHWATDARLLTGNEPNGSDALPAREIQEARFPDGLYRVHALTGDLEAEHESVHPLVVDNFRPYVQRVEVLNLRTGAPLYDRGWSFTASTGTLDWTDRLGDTLEPPAFQNGVLLRITFSEPVVRPTIAKVEPPLGFRLRLVSGQPPKRRNVWSVAVPGAGGSGVGKPRRIHVSAQDLAGCTLHAFGTTAPVAVPFNKRTGLEPLDDPTTDRLHRVPLGY